ncbi:glutathione S-transferase C-terminal domain-containing protein [Actinomadura barringtoniae]|uniref:Glutathione S-transferase C-terminal domain-containing protein n=1 Tax=Actinomadura barringtoniae TaxID=1427535 RepID=A0A939TBM8_9ACTN|nr:glutathione S-transferase C-terminal domain-containing protein [Actinomadura barringtoniae]MBO2450355.1 glutathione S-transferase C-terminal domain-containing protein [Actinomadura barringtoniae]
MTTREMTDGRFVRQANRFTDKITADGSSGYPAESGRYRLIVSYACPWAHRTMIVRSLLGLKEVINLAVVDPIRDEKGWRFPDRDPVTGASFVSELYLASDPEYQGRYTVPCVWDTRTRRLVTNDFPFITTMMETEFTDYLPTGAPDLYPVELRPEIDGLNELIYATVNNGVYRAGFATSQGAYDEAVEALFATFDRLEERLAGRRYLFGDAVTESDVRLYPTLARFDAVYNGHFKCNVRRLTDYPNLWGYARDLFSIPAFGDTTDFDQIKRHYYITQRNVNPSGVVPKGPLIDWSEPQDRAALTSG